MEPEQIAAMRDLIDHLDAALLIADDLAQTLIGAMLCECRERAEHLLDTPRADRN